MKKLFFAGCLMLAACAAKVETKGSLPTPIENSNSVYRVIAEDSIGHTILSGSAVAYKQEIAGSAYKIYFLTARHITSVPLQGLKFYIQFNFIDRFQDYSKEINLGMIPCSIEKSSLYYDVSIMTCYSSEPVNVVNIITDPIKPFTPVYSIGFPLGIGIHITEGLTSHSDHDGMASSLPICPGFSGGGVFDKKTNSLVGILVSVVQVPLSTNGFLISGGFFWDLSYFVPLDKVKEML